MITFFVNIAHAASSSIPAIQLPGGFTADLMAFIGDQLAAWSSYILAIIGIMAVGLVIGILVDHFRK
jgi:hypothetical protein